MSELAKLSETSHLFGEHRHLLGTISIAGSVANTGCVLMSAGVVHRIGPHRINVKLARALTAAGLPSLRMDLAAVGDSRSPPTDTAYDQQAVTDLVAGIDLLIAQTGVSRVIMIGVCSGAIYSLRTALLDQRVIGLHMIDGYAYATPRTRRERFLQRGRTLTAKFIKNAVGARLRNQSRTPSGGPERDYGLSHPPKAQFAADLTQLLDRGVSIYQMFSGSILQNYNYQDQFADGFAQFDNLTAVRTEFTPQFDHTVTALATQRELLERIVPWASGIADATQTHQGHPDAIR